MCSKTAQELKSHKDKTLRCHSIAWADTTEKEGFQNLPPKHKAAEPYQFSVTSNEHGRVHGFFVNDVFHIVWLDPEHSLYGEQ